MRQGFGASGGTAEHRCPQGIRVGTPHGTSGLKPAVGQRAKPRTAVRGLIEDESLLKTRSYGMSWLDIAMAGGLILLVALIILRKKTR